MSIAGRFQLGKGVHIHFLLFVLGWQGINILFLSDMYSWLKHHWNMVSSLCLSIGGLTTMSSPNTCLSLIERIPFLLLRLCFSRCPPVIPEPVICFIKKWKTTHPDEFDWRCVSLFFGAGKLELATNWTLRSLAVRKCLDIVTPGSCCGRWDLCPWH